MFLKTAFFLLFPLMLCIVPMYLYNNRSMICMAWWVKMTLSENSQKIIAKLLALTIALFHIATFALLPHEVGMMFSIPLVAFAASTTRTMSVLTKIRRSRKTQVILADLILAIALIPHGFVLACTMAFFLLAACFLPGDKAGQSLEDHNYLTDAESTFFDDYFS